MSTLQVHGETTLTSSPPPETVSAPAVSPSNERRRASTLDEIRGATTHLVTGYFGHRYEIKIPDLAFMLSHGEIPEALRQVAMREVLNDQDVPLAEQKNPDGTPVLNLEFIRDFYDLRSLILVASLVSPKITVEDIPHLPTEDKDMLQALATRQRVTDALGVRLGVARLDDWETFRTEHGCPEGCEHCQAALARLSTVDMGPL